MSKYIKLEDALNCVNGYFLTGIHKAIESLPTIEVSEDCISRGYLLGKVYDMDNDNLVVDLKEIENAPSVVPSRAGGEWRASTVHSGIVKCSVCVYQAGKYAESKEYKFCPNCGAKMKG